MIIALPFVGWVSLLEFVDLLELILHLDCAKAGREYLVFSPRIRLVFCFVVVIVFVLVFVGAAVLQMSFSSEDSMLTTIPKSPIHELEVEPSLRQSIECITNYLLSLLETIFAPVRVIDAWQIHALNISSI